MFVFLHFILNIYLSFNKERNILTSSHIFCHSNCSVYRKDLESESLFHTYVLKCAIMYDDPDIEMCKMISNLTKGMCICKYKNNIKENELNSNILIYLYKPKYLIKNLPTIIIYNDNVFFGGVSNLIINEIKKKIIIEQNGPCFSYFYICELKHIFNGIFNTFSHEINLDNYILMPNDLGIVEPKILDLKLLKNNGLDTATMKIKSNNNVSFIVICFDKCSNNFTNSNSVNFHNVFGYYYKICGTNETDCGFSFTKSDQIQNIKPNDNITIYPVFNGKKGLIHTAQYHHNQDKNESINVTDNFIKNLEPKGNNESQMKFNKNETKMLINNAFKDNSKKVNRIEPYIWILVIAGILALLGLILGYLLLKNKKAAIREDELGNLKQEETIIDYENPLYKTSKNDPFEEDFQ